MTLRSNQPAFAALDAPNLSTITLTAAHHRTIRTGLLILTILGPVAACDSCGCHLPADLSPATPSLDVGVQEQYTAFDTLRDNGHRVANPDGQYLDSSTTQVIVTVRPVSWLSVSAFVPWISRGYSRPGATGEERGTVAGLGDSTVLAAARLVHAHQDDDETSVNLIAGIKIPTGRPGQLSSELVEADEASAGGEEIDSGGAADPSAVGGHDLALGFGAWDPIVGLSGGTRHGRWFATMQGTWSFNTEGAYRYRVAPELSADLGIGYALLDDAWRVTVQGNVTVESKGQDTVAGHPTDDTGNHDLFAGPEVAAVVDRRVQAHLGLDLPLIERNSATQLVPTWRLRGGMDWRF